MQEQNGTFFEYLPGISVHYETQGHGPVPVLFIHGFAASIGTWDDLRELFPADRYTLTLLDLAGFGRSSKPRHGRYGPEHQAALILAFLEAHRISGVTVVGHSLGGTIALVAVRMARTAGTHGLIGSLILIGTPAWPQPLPRFFRILRTPVVGSMLLRLLPARVVVARALASVYWDRGLIDERHIRRYLDCFRGRGTITALVRTVRQIVPENWEEICGGYAATGMPVLLVWGSDDRVVKLRQAERLRDTIPGARLAVLARCGHNPHEEHPAETWRLIQSFLEDPASPGG